MQFTVQSGGVPVGNYRANFEGIEPVQANGEKSFGPGIRFRWKIIDGPFTGQFASRITSASPTPANSCGKMISCVLGRALAIGENVNLQSYVGRTYLVVVEATPSGGTRVSSAIPI